MNKILRDIIRNYERQNLLGKGYVVDNRIKGDTLAMSMAKRGYSAYRISYRVIRKPWGKYRTVYGATIYPNYKQAKIKGKFVPQIKWYKQGVIKAGKKRGTFKLHSLSDFVPSMIRNMMR